MEGRGGGDEGEEVALKEAKRIRTRSRGQQ